MGITAYHCTMFHHCQVPARSRISDVERMMWALLHVPLAAERAQLPLLQRTFPDRVAAVAQRIEALEQGYHVLMRSEDLPQLLLLVRGIANILNHSTTSYRPQIVVIP